MGLNSRNFLAETDFTFDEWLSLLELSARLKAEKKAGKEVQRLSGKNIALIFEKTSTRTRCAFEVAAHDQGAHVTYLDPAGSQLGHKESVADTARVLGRMYDGIEYRGFGQSVVEELARYAGVPVFNGLTDEWHPTQMLADQLTMMEHSGKALSELKIAYVGDARSNMGNSVLVANAMMGADVRIIAPAEVQPSAEVQEIARARAAETGGKVLVTDDLAAVDGADFVLTDIWVSMGEPEEVWEKRIELLRDYQVNQALLDRTGNPEVKAMHCLPAYHDLNTTMGKKLGALTGMTEWEITDEVFEANAEIIFDEAENRMHTIKAVLVALLG